MLLSLQSQELEDIKKFACYSQQFQFLNTGLTLYSDNAAFIDMFASIYKNFIQSSQPKNNILCYILKNSTGIKPLAVVDGIAYQLFTKELFFSHAHMVILQHVIDAIDDHLLIHAGVVAKNGKGFIIAGPSAFGKTTLMLELVARGYKFYSDEFCALRLSDYAISAFPRSLGIRKNSPFLKHIDANKCLLLKNIGRGEKFLIDCKELFPGSIGSNCDARYFILLRGVTDKEHVTQKTIIDLALYSKNQELIETLCKNNGIELMETCTENNYIIYRFLIPLHTGLMNTFRSICDQYRDDIFYQEQLVNEIPDFTALPSMESLSKSQASLEMLKNIRNRSSKSKLLERFKGKNSQLLLTIGDFVKNIDCYEMKIGSLHEMAEMVDAL
jgi:hypothetical protein